MTATRNDLRTHKKSSYGWGLGFLIFDGMIYSVALYFAVTEDALWKQLIWSVVAGFCTAGLLIVAHDACHQSLTPNRTLNRFIGTVAFLPALHAYSLWRHGHNFLHHLHTNQRGKDYVWEPLSPKEYNDLSRWQRAKYRFYRSFVGHYFYYPCEIWIRRRFIPRRLHVGTITAEHWFDSFLVMLWMALLGSVLIFIHTGHEGVSFGNMAYWPEPLIMGIALPFFLNGMLNSDSTYLHHTHPEIHWSWDAPANGWEDHQTHTSIHVRYARPVDWFLHWIMDHTAHHLQPSIPLYRLKDAQRELERQHGERIVSYRFSFAAMFRILNACKLYDDKQGCWTDFEGRPTSDSRCKQQTDKSVTDRMAQANTPTVSETSVNRKPAAMADCSAGNISS